MKYLFAFIGMAVVNLFLWIAGVDIPIERGADALAITILNVVGAFLGYIWPLMKSKE